MAINLFDFSQNQSKIPNATGYLSQFQKKEAPVLNFGSPMSGVTNFKDSGIAQVKPTQKPTTPTSSGFSVIPKASANNDYLSELEYDIKNGATVDEILKAYPEVKNNSKIVNELIYDINNGATVDEIKQAYPELSVIQSNPKTERNFNIAQGLVSSLQDRYNQATESRNPLISALNLPVIGGDKQLQVTGAIGGAVGDVGGAIIQSLLPVDLKQKADSVLGKDNVDYALKTIQAGGQIYEQARKQNPDLFQYVEDISNTAGIIGGGAGLQPTVNKAGKGVLKAGEKVVEGTSKGLDNLGAKKQQVLSGLTKEQVAGLQSNPVQADEFTKMVDRFESTEGIADIKDYKTERVGAVTKEVTDAIDELKSTKGDTGPLYQQVRQLDLQLDPKETFNKIESTLNSKGIVRNEKGKYVADGTIKSQKYSEADLSNINKFISSLEFESQNGFITPGQVLDARELSRIFAKYDATKTTDGMAIFQQIRRDINDTIRDKIPGLKDLDKQFIDKLDQLDDATRDLVYKGGDIKGEWRSNIVNIIGTLDKQNRAKLLERLEEVMPGIGEKIKAIDNLDTLYKSLNSKGVFERFTGVGGAFAGASAMSGLPIVGPVIGAILGYTGGKLLETGITAVRKKALQNVLQKISDDGLKKLEEINKKIESNQLLKQKEKDIINSIKSQIKNEERNLKNNGMNNNTVLPRTNMNSNSTTNTTSKNIITPKKSFQELTGQPIKPKVLPKKKSILSSKEQEKIDKIKKESRELPRTSNIDKIDPRTGEGFDKNGKSLGIVDKRPLQKSKATLSEKGGVKTISPEFQHKFNQGDDYKAVRVISNPVDSKIIRYGALENKLKQSVTGKGLKLSESEKLELKSIEKELKMTREEILNRSNDIKQMAKSVRSKDEQVILDLNSPKTQLETTLKGATSNNINEVVQSVAKTLKTTKTAEIKTIIQRYLKEFGEDFKNKIGDLISEIAEKVGAKINLVSSKEGIGAEKTKLLNQEGQLERLNPMSKNKYTSGDFKSLNDLDSDDLFRAIGTRDWENIPKQVTLYRGIKSNKDFDLFPGDFLTKNKKIAENFAGPNGKVKSFKVDTKDLKGSDFGYEEVVYQPNNNPKLLPKTKRD